MQCEIDKEVVETSKKYFPTTLATSFNDPRFELRIQDAAVYMKDHKGEFDVIIVDSSDPVGPAESLYTSAFYADMKDALKAGGIVCTQGAWWGLWWGCAGRLAARLTASDTPSPPPSPFQASASGCTST